MNGEIVLIEIFEILAHLFAGGLVVPAVNWLKEKLGVESWRALALSAVVSIVFGVALAFAEGQIGLADLEASNLATAFIIIFASAQTVFRMLQNSE